MMIGAFHSGCSAPYNFRDGKRSINTPMRCWSFSTLSAVRVYYGGKCYFWLRWIFESTNEFVLSDIVRYNWTVERCQLVLFEQTCWKNLCQELMCTKNSIEKWTSEKDQSFSLASDWSQFYKRRKMFSIESLEFESIMNRHLFDYQTTASTASSLSSTDLFMCNDNSTDSDLYSSYNSDQENNIDKM